MQDRSATPDVDVRRRSVVVGNVNKNANAVTNNELGSGIFVSAEVPLPEVAPKFVFQQV